jgi:serine/threonine protein phosphatase PrpC
LGSARTPAPRLELAWRTETGQVRACNEDAVGVYPEDGLVIVADGIGGASAGEVASSLAVRTVSERFRSGNSRPADRQEARRRAQEAVAAANQVIWESAQATPRHAGMGTTLVMGYLGPEWLVFAHVGDSRLYRLRNANLVQLTRDHSLIQEVVDQGFFQTMEDAQRYGINQNILTRALGTADPVAIDCGEETLHPGDIFLFCTDGLTGMVTDTDIRRALLSSGDELDQISGSLIDLACEEGGLDNITVALARISCRDLPR